jgi:6-pyruvoyltetrahydropterin/6-carboxytetrahydropterin synthase
MIVTRRAEFSASHDCSTGLHGHNFAVEVGVEGEPDPITGMVLDLKELKEILEREILEPFDHRFLNREVAPFDRVVPTPENIAIEIWRRLATHLDVSGRRLHSVRLYETEDLFVDYHGGAA